MTPDTGLVPDQPLTKVDPAVPLPTTMLPLRDELSLHEGPRGADGAPTWTLRDPARQKFFRLSWPAFEMLSRWQSGGPAEIAAQVNADTPLKVGAEDVTDLARFLAFNQLLRSTRPSDTARLVEIEALDRPSLATWLLHHYLFFRIPLVRPDQMLEKTAPYVGWIATRTFVLATMAALVVGLGLLMRQWDHFAATLADTFNLQGAVVFAGALAVAKVVHELAHACTAKRMGCRVGTMGVAFLVMWPVLYTDVNESWLLSDSRQRLAIGIAGIAAEMTLGIWAMLFWGLLPDGACRQAALAFATTSWMSSVLLNASPFMRFDGYFLLMDALNMPNLHARAFALARWRLRESLFGFGEPAPERFAPFKERALVAFAWATWIYRLVVFLGIAVLVYHVFFKLLGIALFIVEIWWFVAAPVWSELRAWGERGSRLWQMTRGKVTFGLLAALAGLTFVPVEMRASAPAILQAAQITEVYPPTAGILEEISIADRDRVSAGMMLFKLYSPALVHQRDQAARRIAVVQQELGAVGFDPSLRSRTQSLREELQTATTQRMAADRELMRQAIVAPIDGKVTDVEPSLMPGQWVSPRNKLAAILGNGPAHLVAYVSEDNVERIAEGASARFIPHVPGRGVISARIVSIERSVLLHLDVPALASLSGGPIVIRPGDAELTPDHAVYRVHLEADVPAPNMEIVGTIHIEATATSLVGRLWQSLLATVLRESGM